MSIILVLLVAVSGSLCVLGGVKFVQHCAQGKREFGLAIVDFYDAADVFIRDAETPQELLEIIADLNESICDDQVAGTIVRHLADYRWWKDRSAGPSHRWKVAHEFVARRPELQATLTKLVVQWFIAVTALAPLSGALARVAMAEGSVEQAASRANLRRRSRSGDRAPPGAQAIGA